MRRAHVRLLSFAVLFVVLVGALAACDDTHTSIPALTPTPKAVAPTPTPLPDGWYRILDGQPATFAGSLPQAGISVACPSPQDPNKRVALSLALSSDGGHTWKSQPVSGASPTGACIALADTKQPTAYVVQSSDGNTYETTDAGATWHMLKAPDGYSIALMPSTSTFVGGYLTALLHDVSNVNVWHFAELTPSGTWKMLYEHLPYHDLAGADTPPVSFSVDPADPAHLYAAMATGPTGISLYATHDSGATWKQVSRWPGSTQVQVWTAPNNTVYADDVIDPGAPRQFFTSFDGGTTWASLSLHDGNADDIFVSPDGSVVTLYSGAVYDLDPKTGNFTTIGPAPEIVSGLACAVTAGARATILCSTPDDAYARALPAHA